LDDEINNILFAIDEVLDPAGLDLGEYSYIDTPAPGLFDPIVPVDPVDPVVPVDPVDPVDAVPPTTAETISALIQQAEGTGDYTDINQFLADQKIRRLH